MSAKPEPIVLPSAGQTWRAPAPRVHGGFRYVRIEQIRHAEPAYAIAHEVTASGGKPRTGSRTYRTADNYRGISIFLHPVTGTLPPPYERVPE